MALTSGGGEGEVGVGQPGSQRWDRDIEKYEITKPLPFAFSSPRSVGCTPQPPWVGVRTQRKVEQLKDSPVLITRALVKTLHTPSPQSRQVQPCYLQLQSLSWKTKWLVSFGALRGASSMCHLFLTLRQKSWRVLSAEFTWERWGFRQEPAQISWLASVALFLLCWHSMVVSFFWENFNPWKCSKLWNVAFPLELTWNEEARVVSTGSLPVHNEHLQTCSNLVFKNTVNIRKKRHKEWVNQPN